MNFVKFFVKFFDNSQPFWPFLSPINNSTYKLAKLLVPVLTGSEYTVKDSFAFTKKIFEQDSDLFMGSLDVDSLFTDIPLEVTFDICGNTFLKNWKSRRCIKNRI